MKILNEQHRISHQQAQLIPASLLFNRDFFNAELCDIILHLMQIPYDHHFEDYVDNHLQSIKTLLVNQKRACLIAVLISHPKMPNFVFWRFTKIMELSNFNILLIASSVGRVDLVNKLLAMESKEDIADMITVENFYVIRHAAKNGHLEVVNRLTELFEEDGDCSIQQMFKEHAINENKHGFFGKNDTLGADKVEGNKHDNAALKISKFENNTSSPRQP